MDWANVTKIYTPPLSNAIFPLTSMRMRGTKAFALGLKFERSGGT